MNVTNASSVTSVGQSQQKSTIRTSNQNFQQLYEALKTAKADSSSSSSGTSSSSSTSDTGSSSSVSNHEMGHDGSQVKLVYLGSSTNSGDTVQSMRQYAAGTAAYAQSDLAQTQNNSQS